MNHFRKTLTATLLFILVSVVALNGCGEKEPIDTTRVTANRAKVEKCSHDHSECIGGFVVFSDKSISRISLGEDGFGTYSVNSLISGTNIYGDPFLMKIKTINLPSDENWGGTAVAYAKQFVQRKK